MLLWLPLASLVVLVQGEVPESAPVVVSTAGQSVVQELDDPVQVDDIEVRGRRGAARVPPETELSGAEIDALGAWDIGEVLIRLSETLAVDEAPMVIINGKRVPNSGVFSSFPPDALVRAEVLPPEATTLYGGLPGQRVVNLVLQRRFSGYDGRVTGSRPTQGGTSALSGDLRRSTIADENTHQLGFRVSRDTALRAEERDRDFQGAVPDAGAVTIRPRSDVISANATLTRSLGEWSGVFSLNGQIREARSTASIGGAVVESRRRNESLGGSAGLSGTVFGWTLQTNLNGQASRRRDDGFNDTRSEAQSLSLNASVSRNLLELPTGPVVANLSGNLMGSRSIIDRPQASATTNFQTRDWRGSLAIPLSKADAQTAMGRLIGDLQATLGGGSRESSGGGGDDVSGGLDWAPRKGVRLNAVWTKSSDSVSDIERYEPLYYDTPRVVFDFRAGKAVEIIPILGGNPDLRPPRSERLSLTAGLGPFSSWSLSGSLGYQRAETTDGIGSLPELTEDIEAAFPDRIQRDPSGRLVSIDYRPMNQSSSVAESLNGSLTFGLPRPSGPTAGEATVLRATLAYNLSLTNNVTLLVGQPNLDRLKGDAGGVARQDVRFMLDARRGRWGFNASARWQDGYRTRRISGTDNWGDLLIEPLTSVNLKLSLQMRSSVPRLSLEGDEGRSRRRSSGLQLNLEVENLFDERPSAYLGDGSPAPGYGRDIQDPIGRTVRLTIQRRF